MYEVRWLRRERVVEVREYPIFEVAKRDVDQLLDYYRVRFDVSAAEIWDRIGQRHYVVNGSE